METRLNPTPALSRYVPLATLIAIAAQVLTFSIFFQAPSGGGSGGKVLGQMSVRLGGAGAAGTSERPEVELLVETTVALPEPRAEQQLRAPVEPDVQQSRAVQARPITRQPIEVPRESKSIEQTPKVHPVAGNEGDGNPIGSMTVGSPSLGEGVASETAGVGSTDADAGDRRDAYLALIRARIEQNRTYPSVARRRREEGMATLKIKIDERGALADVQLVMGSGSFHLDRAARRMVEKSAPFPAPPITPFVTTIPIVFVLR